MDAYRHFEFDTLSPKTVISREYPKKWEMGDTPYYPINDDTNNSLYLKYKELGEHLNIYFGGRLGSYRYYDMDDTIIAAFELLNRLD